jgi:hypothetical protein
MTEEDEEFNRIEREAGMRKEAARDAIQRHPDSYLILKNWVGLTDEDKEELRRETHGLPELLMMATEAKLKAKNT